MAKRTQAPRGSRPLAGGRAMLRTGRDGRRTIRIDGVVDQDLVDAITADIRQALEHGEELLLDLRLASLLNPRPLRNLLRSLTALGFHSALLCGRISAQMLLRRWGITEQVTVVDDHGGDGDGDRAPPV